MIGSRQSVIDFWQVFGVDLWKIWPHDVLGQPHGRIWLNMYRIAGNLGDIRFMLMRMHIQLDNLLYGTNYAVPEWSRSDECTTCDRSEPI